LLLLVTESDPEVGSNAVDYSLLQRRSTNDRSGVRKSVPLTVVNLVASANRFDTIADSVMRIGSTSRHQLASKAASPSPPPPSRHLADHCAVASRVAAAAFARVVEAQQRQHLLAQRIRNQMEHVQHLREQAAGRQRSRALATDADACADRRGPLDGSEQAVEVFEQAVLVSSASFGPAVSTVLASAAPADEGAAEARGHSAGHDDDHVDAPDWDGPATPASPASPLREAPASPDQGGSAGEVPAETRTMTDIFGPDETAAPPSPKRDAADIDTYF
jgi:hypothetical protein